MPAQVYPDWRVFATDAAAFQDGSCRCPDPHAGGTPSGVRHVALDADPVPVEACPPSSPACRRPMRFAPRRNRRLAASAKGWELQKGVRGRLWAKLVQIGVWWRLQKGGSCRRASEGDDGRNWCKSASGGVCKRVGVAEGRQRAMVGGFGRNRRLLASAKGWELQKGVRGRWWAKSVGIGVWRRLQKGGSCRRASEGDPFGLVVDDSPHPVDDMINDAGEERGRTDANASTRIADTTFLVGNDYEPRWGSRHCY
jgi:hypothetical protein